VTLIEKGSFARGKRVVAFDNAANKVYLADFTRAQRGRLIERVYEYQGYDIRKEWNLPEAFSIPSAFAFDFNKERFYVGFFESAVVEAFDLNSGSPPSQAVTEPEPPAAPSRDTNRRPDRGKGGRCGDNICQPIESSKGVCPQDCP